MGNVANRVFESAGPDGKVRGTPQQIIDKYQALARDAQLSGDRVIAENYLQHSEHYSRLLGEATRHLNEQRAAQQERESAQQGQQRSDSQGGEGDDDRDGRETQQQRDRQSGESRQDRDDRRDRDVQQNRDNQNRDNGRDGDHDRGARHSSDDQPRGDNGLTTIDPSDDRAESGPVETPEGRRRNARVTRPAERENDVPSEAEATSADEAAPQQATRPRTRRKAKVESESGSAAAQAE